MMRIDKLWRVGMIGVLAVGIFVLIQILGGYLIAEITLLDGHDDEVTVEVVEKTILRLEAEDYYTYEIGVYSEPEGAQSVIDSFAKKGYRVWVSEDDGYRLYIGCWGEAPADSELPAIFRELGSEGCVSKRTLNAVSLKYKDSADIYAERIAPMIAAVDVVLKYSLKMFECGGYEQYAAENWQEMIGVLSQEMTEIETEIAAICLSSESEEWEREVLTDLQGKIGNYRESLEYITSGGNDEAVYLAQSYLLELIDNYHDSITKLSASAE